MSPGPEVAAFVAITGVSTLGLALFWLWHLDLTRKRRLAEREAGIDPGETWGKE